MNNNTKYNNYYKNNSFYCIIILYKMIIILLLPLINNNNNNILVNGHTHNDLLATCPMESLSLAQIGNDIISGLPGDLFGRYVSVSNNGKVIAIGARHNDNGENSGAVYVLERNNNNEWVQKGQIIYSKNAYGLTDFNTLSGNGNIIAIGARDNDVAEPAAGQVRVFQFINNSWIQMGSDINGLKAVDRFGYGLDLSDDGSILAVGAEYGGVNDEGQVRIFKYNSNTQQWEQRGNTINGGKDNASLREVSLSEDGNILAVGAYRYDIDQTIIDAGLNNAGRVRVYQYNTINNNWQQRGQDLVGNNAYDKFGYSIVLSPDGTELTIAASPKFIDNKQGYITTYIYQGVAWVQQGNVLLSEETGDEFGYSISRSVNILVVGSPYNDGNGYVSGRAQIFYRQNNNWTQIFNSINGQEEYQFYGIAVAVSKDGSTIAIGGDGSGSYSVKGIVQVFGLNCVLPPTVSPVPTISPAPSPQPTRARLPPIPPIVVPTPTEFPSDVPVSDPAPSCLFGFICVCFSATNLVQVKGKGLVQINELQIGDFVQATIPSNENQNVPDGNIVYSRLISFSHKDEISRGSFLKFFTKKMKNKEKIVYNQDDVSVAFVEISNNHMVQKLDASFVRAEDIRLGDILYGGKIVVQIDFVESKGSYAPVTGMGTIVVSGITASCYVALLDNLPPWIQHYSAHALYAPMRLFTLLYSFQDNKWNNNEVYTEDGLSDNYVINIVKLVYKVRQSSIYIQIMLALVFLPIVVFVLVTEKLLLSLFIMHKLFVTIIIVCLATLYLHPFKREKNNE